VGKNRFDLVFAGELIEHLYDTDYFFEEANKVLKAGGYLIITTPNLPTMAARFVVCARKE